MPFMAFTGTAAGCNTDGVITAGDCPDEETGVAVEATNISEMNLFNGKARCATLLTGASLKPEEGCAAGSVSCDACHCVEGADDSVCGMNEDPN